MLCLNAGGNHLPGAQDPVYLYATLQKPPTPTRGSTYKGSRMNMNAQEGSAAGRPENIPQHVVGMDAHAPRPLRGLDVSALRRRRPAPHTWPRALGFL